MPAAWLEATVIATTIAFTPPAKIDESALGPRILVCNDLLSVQLIHFTPPAHRPTRVLQRRCVTYPANQLEFITHYWISIGPYTLSLQVYRHVTTRTTLYGFAE